MESNDQNRSLGEHIRQARVARGLALRELARQVRRSPSYVSDIEYDRRVPSEGVLREICEVLDLDFDLMLASTGRLGADAERYLKREPSAGLLFRRVSQERLREDELRQLIVSAEDLAKKRRSPPATQETP